eukprot:CAMPEP_0184488802 /NCGR_PEP_ID=MMETSP0113_2-20130426/13492_1 /TAXON_ID=91329 /ORGANISM="Norrisiella sphaerica, Strain BC52" /LENGTH=664 /DNA_ID=CAMNT_0026871839 /DNA_START=96 /DNA_END=2090 /DNA_ORIENTATION=+
MKIVIRGANETGKTALLRRLEGKSFLKEHLPTPQIQVAHIDWNYKTTSDLVQVEVWDVVDKGNLAEHEARIRQLVAQGRLAPGAVPKAAVADASTVDVYKKCNAILMMMDPTRRWTFDYVREEMKKVPSSCQVLIMANFRDLHSRRQVSENEIENFLRSCDGNTNYIECCMMNGYGLKQLYNWLNIPFLLLKQQCLKNELELATAELKTAQHEAQLVQEQDYDSYIKLVNMQMSLQNRPPIPTTGPIPKTQAPGSSKPSRGGAAAVNTKEAPAAQVTSHMKNAKTSKDAGKRNPRKQMPPVQHIIPTPTPAPAGGHDDDLDNFNAGALDAGFFGDDDDGEEEEMPEDDDNEYGDMKGQHRDSDDEGDNRNNKNDNNYNINNNNSKNNKSSQLNEESEDDEEDLPQEEDDEDAMLEEHEAIQTNAYSVAPAPSKTARKAGNDREIRDEKEDVDAEGDSDAEAKREEVLDVQEPDDDDEESDLDALDKTHEPVKYAVAAMPETDGGADDEEEGDEENEEEREEKGLREEKRGAQSPALNTDEGKDATRNFVAPKDSSLKGFYSDDGEEEEDDDDDDVEADTDFAKPPAATSNDLDDDGAEAADSQTGSMSGYGEFKEFAASTSRSGEKQVKKKKKKKKNKERDPDDDSAKKKKKKKKKKKADREKA